MNYISSEEFLNQSQKVQTVLKEWWNPQIGDLCYEKDSDLIFCCNGFRKETNEVRYEEIHCVFEWNKKCIIPLLQMHQLIQFIQEKINGKIDICNACNGKGYEVSVDSLDYSKTLLARQTMEADLLQALWKVAIEIAEKI